MVCKCPSCERTTFGRQSKTCINIGLVCLTIAVVLNILIVIGKATGALREDWSHPRLGDPIFIAILCFLAGGIRFLAREEPALCKRCRNPPARTRNRAAETAKVKTKDLSGTRITDAGLREVARKNPDLETLYLRNTNISDEGVRHLAKLKYLKELDVRDTAVTRACVAWIELSNPDCTVLHNHTNTIEPSS